MSRRKNTYLIGFSGSGKSVLGRLLAQRRKARFYDTDTLIERRCGKEISRIFMEDGEQRFRRAEAEIISELAEDSPSPKVIALGGGAFQSRQNRAIIRQSGIVVYLSCPVGELYRRLKNKTDRPLLDGRRAKGRTSRQALIRRIRQLLDSRKRNYLQADIRVSTANKSIDETVTEVVRKLGRYHASR
jgi:shikimate kinase